MKRDDPVYKAQLAQLQNEIKEMLMWDTLEAQNWDRKDFHEIHCATMKNVIELCFLRGINVEVAATVIQLSNALKQVDPTAKA